MVSLSAVIITRNEAHQVERTVAAAQQCCDEVVVVDSGSTDGTVALCQAMGCRVFHKPFESYGVQKNFGISQAHGPWILSLDADEVCTPELIAEINHWKQQPHTKVVAYYIPRSMVFLGRRFVHSREARQPILRLFKKSNGAFDEALVHETLIVKGNTDYMHGELLHYSYRNLHHYFEKFNQYTSYAADAMAQKGVTVSWLKILTRQPFEFIKIYFLQGNFREGAPGLVWSIISSFYPVVKYLKLKTKYMRPQQPN